MDYATSSSSSSSSRQPSSRPPSIRTHRTASQNPLSLPSIPVPSIQYPAAFADSPRDYVSPYTRGDDLPRHQTRSPAQTIGILPDFIDPRRMSAYSSSSRGSSVYSSPGPHQQRIASGMANSSRSASGSISAVSRSGFLVIPNHRILVP